MLDQITLSFQKKKKKEKKRVNTTAWPIVQELSGTCSLYSMSMGMKAESPGLRQAIQANGATCGSTRGKQVVYSGDFSFPKRPKRPKTRVWQGGQIICAMGHSA